MTTTLQFLAQILAGESDNFDAAMERPIDDKNVLVDYFVTVEEETIDQITAFRCLQDKILSHQNGQSHSFLLFVPHPLVGG